MSSSNTDKVVLGNGVTLAKWRIALQAELAKELAKSIIINRLEPVICPSSYDHITARQLYDSVANTRQETATAPYSIALERFWSTKFATTADAYIDQFQANLQNVNQAADNLAQQTDIDYHVPKGQAAALHRHKNKDYFRQHPELAVGPEGERWRSRHVKDAAKVAGKDKGKGKAAAQIDSDSDIDFELDYENVGVGATASFNKFPSIYDTGASHHFLPCKTSFIKLHNRPRAFRFDQAVGSSSLTKQGTARCAIGNTVFTLADTLYSPNSHCNITSAGRLQRLGGIEADMHKSQLVYKKQGQPDIPIATLVRTNDVYYIEPLKKDSSKLVPIAASGVARIPKTTSAQRWHQRLGHIGQKILKKTAECSKGMEGIDTSELTVCETCHLSKAQRYVSREPRPTPADPLDEVFIDTVGKLTTAIN
ncbi:hypothetical protein K3495_g13855 [Podosphaera aphanis]|nr:hypothetical protein K3495_g13855 [Podosphaera aphanis]